MLLITMLISEINADPCYNMLGQTITCPTPPQETENSSINPSDYFMFEFDRTNLKLGAKIPEEVLAEYIADQPTKYLKNTTYNKEEANSFKLDGIDVAGQKLNISFKVRDRIYENLPVPHCYGAGSVAFCVGVVAPRMEITEISDVKCSAEATLTPEINSVNGYFKFVTGDTHTNNCDASGLINVISYLLLHPALALFGPEGYLVTSLLTDAVAGHFADETIQGENGEETPVEMYNDIWNKINQYVQIQKLVATSTILDETGLWIVFSFSMNDADLLYEEIAEKAGQFINVISGVDYATAFNDISRRILGRELTATEIAGFVDIINQGGSLNDVQNEIFAWTEAENVRHLDGFQMDEFSTSYNQLIVSMAGGSPYLRGAMSKTSGPIETLKPGEKPSSSDNFGDGIYQLAANYIDGRTIAVISYPWLTSVGTATSPDTYWGPSANSFADKIEEALSRMAPNTELILVGKSMGGCRMQQVVHELQSKNIPVELLIFVDASCSPYDQSAIVMDIPRNVKSVYNFHQTQPYPDNDNQNGFLVTFSSPTTGDNVDVGAYDASIGGSMCGNAGHDDIDECYMLQKEIDRLIKREIFPKRIANVINMLLFD